jgi:hypothetical protein
MTNQPNDGLEASSDGVRTRSTIDPKSISITPASPPNEPVAPTVLSETELWAAAGFNVATQVDGEGSSTTCFALPEGYIALTNDQPETATMLIDLFLTIEASPKFWLRGEIEYVVFRYEDPKLPDLLQQRLVPGISMLKKGALIPLPPHEAYFAKRHGAKSPDEIPLLTLPDGALQKNDDEPLPSRAPVAKDVPLLKFSLQGKADELNEKALAATPLLGQVCRSGQATIWYAPSNSGKTLIGISLAGEAIRERRLEPGNLYYVNADDNSMGLAQKARIFDDWGAHMLVPGFKDFRAAELQNLLIEMARSDKARGVVLIIDTIKKFVSLMDKKDSSRFADACRQFVLQGGTVLALAHTNKNPSASGRLKYAGTTDLVEDFDAAFIIEPIDLEQPGGEKVVRFESEKRRGDTPEKAAFAYSTENGLTYEQLLASVEAVTFDRLGEIERTIEQRTDAELVETVKACIRDGVTTKMHIASEAAKRSKTSGKGIIRILDRYTGDDPAKHHWKFTVGERGKHIFQLLPADDPGAPTSG